jgi:hypothetical protein
MWPASPRHLVRRIADDDHVIDGRTFRQDRRNAGQQHRIDDQRAVAGMIDDGADPARLAGGH